MRGEAQMTVPELARVFGTRAALGVGLGLVLANCFSSAEKRAAVGWTLLLAGGFAATTLAFEIFGHPHALTLAFGTEAHAHGVRSEPRNEEKVLAPT